MESLNGGIIVQCAWRVIIIVRSMPLIMLAWLGKKVNMYLKL